MIDFQRKIKEILDTVHDLNKGFYAIDIEGMRAHDRKKYCELWASYDKLCREAKREMSEMISFSKEK